MSTKKSRPVRDLARPSRGSPARCLARTISCISLGCRRVARCRCLSTRPLFRARMWDPRFGRTACQWRRANLPCVLQQANRSTEDDTTSSCIYKHYTEQDAIMLLMLDNNLFAVFETRRSGDLSISVEVSYLLSASNCAEAIN